ncbi:MAG: TRAP transporter small permease subunit [Candidatus Thiodiazotropha sp. (ex Lucinoma kastoroae)]|nr:TRAP transporter small permease subunit [Candidatus Thiodiazotropha sp. (ex Lucinoma borealis)]MCU7849069.1 TRAP transporter small permease subunit [Candidatus Thiodiazotropha sp. (ex Lucinoma kastoroae)]MCU7857313.1 TRAP transporter small permease subunit [Candidatus Thiodiazotropha sp. (ex Lucinoma borealis)]MCU7866045.1 TRAP transporter small permease subunit [Candidatus Thiodiazotropha sp. (ex Lucinoma borealis)]MCU7870748.1 TRAP transporter small permease subunit [Candidatus Thiodiazotr
MREVIVSLERLAKLFEYLNEWLGRAVSWLSLFMVLVTFTVVVLRYVFDLGWIWVQESVTFMHGALFLIGAAYTLKHEGHVRVDIFYQRRSPKGRAWVDLFGTLFLLLPVCLFIFTISWDYVAQSWSLQEGSREAGGLDGVYLFKSLILIMAGLMLLQGMTMIIRSLSQILGVSESVEAGR